MKTYSNSTVLNWNRMGTLMLSRVGSDNEGILLKLLKNVEFSVTNSND